MNNTKIEKGDKVRVYWDNLPTTEGIVDIIPNGVGDSWNIITENGPILVQVFCKMVLVAKKEDIEKDGLNKTIVVDDITKNCSTCKYRPLDITDITNPSSLACGLCVNNDHWEVAYVNCKHHCKHNEYIINDNYFR